MRGFDPAFGVDQRVGVASRWSTCSTLTWDSPLVPANNPLEVERGTNQVFVDFEPLGRQWAKLVDGQFAVSLFVASSSA